MEAKLMAGLLAIALLFVSFYGFYRYGRHAEYVMQENIRLTAINNANIENAKLLKQLEIDHEQANAALNVLLDTPVPRVRIPACSGASKPATRGVQGIEADRILSGRIEEILGADRSRTQGIIGEVEHELNDCRLIKDWASKQ